MDCLFFASLTESLIDPATWWIIFQVAIGLGMVIFVHELGHFAVAKWCGVKCDKFYLGFDIFGLKLCKFQWGETEYGIGILPLGGYVSMLGQTDNPGAAAAERERAMAAGSDGAEPQLDPRSYTAKSVPQRMAIISAGVVMNLIFCFVVAAIAYGMGVFYVPAEFSTVTPGDTAWLAGLRSGDQVVAIDGVEQPRFDQDLRVRVMLGAAGRPIKLDVRRPGVEKLLSVSVTPEFAAGQSRKTIGVVPISSLFVGGFAPGEKTGNELKVGDQVLKVNGQAVDSFVDWQRLLLTHPRDTLSVTVARPTAEPTLHEIFRERVTSPVEEVTVELPAVPLADLGFSLELGPVSAVQADSPAAAADLRVGDLLEAIDGQPVGDPLTLAERLRQRGGETVELTIRRAGKESPITVSASLREVTWVDTVLSPRSPISLPALGVACQVENRVTAVAPDGPAYQDGQGVRVGDKFAECTFVFDNPETKPQTYEFAGENAVAWPFVMRSLSSQWREGLKVEASLEGGRKVTIVPVASNEQFSVDRGVAFFTKQHERRAASLGEALALGARDTWEFSTQVYFVLQKLFTRELGANNLGGPVKIAAAAGASASVSLSHLLMFLAMLSANLAVLNFLPVPVLDGGHMVFLILEGIRGKPVSERIVEKVHWVGLFFLLGLMLFVLRGDILWLAGG